MAGLRGHARRQRLIDRLLRLGVPFTAFTLLLWPLLMYAAFLLQGPVLIGLALALRPFDLPGEGNALVVASVGVVASFALAWPLVTRTRLPGIL